MVSKGQFMGLDWNRITRLHSQVMIGTQEVKNSLTASRCHLKAYQRCGQPTSKVSILKMKQQQHDINLRRTRKKKSESQMGFESTTLRDLVGCSNHLSYWLCSRVMRFQSRPINWPLLTIESPVAQVVRASD